MIRRGLDRRALLRGTAASALGFSALASGLLVPAPAHAAAFSPTSISNCVLWLRADLGVTSSAGKVSAWADQSGNSNNFAQATGGLQPTLNSVSSLFQGWPCIGFNGTTSMHASQSFNYMPFTLFIIFRRTGTNPAVLPSPGQISAMFSTDNPGSTGGQSIGFDGSNNLELEINDGSAFFIDTTLAVTLNQPSMVYVNWLGTTTSGGAAQVEGALNNIRAFNPTFSQSCYTSQSLASSAGTDIGCYDAAAQPGRFNCVADIAEIVAYSGTLAPADLDTLIGYFQSRYRVPGNFDTPYRVGFWRSDGTPSRGSGQGEFLRVASSPDGVNFDEFYALYTPSSGSVRDASMMYDAGKWWVAHTQNGLTGTGTTFGLASSINGHGWTPVANPSVASISGVQYPWGPKWYFDAANQPHILIACSVAYDTGLVMYEMHPTNAAMTTWSNPVALTLGTGMPTGAQGIIDFHAFWFHDILYAVMKDETTKLCVLAQSSGDWNGTWTSLNTNLGSWLALEGFSVVVLGPQHIRVYMDDYNGNYGGGLHYSDGTGSTNPNAMSWTTPAAIAINSPAASGTRNGVFTLANDTSLLSLGAGG